MAEQCACSASIRKIVISFDTPNEVPYLIVVTQLAAG